MYLTQIIIILGRVTNKKKSEKKKTKKAKRSVEQEKDSEETLGIVEEVNDFLRPLFSF